MCLAAFVLRSRMPALRTHTHNNAVQTLIKSVRVATWYVSGCLCAPLNDGCVHTHTHTITIMQCKH